MQFCNETRREVTAAAGNKKEKGFVRSSGPFLQIEKMIMRPFVFTVLRIAICCSV